MKVKSDHRIDGCIAVEIACAEIYGSLSKRFPEAGVLWNELSGEEKKQSVSLIMAMDGRLEDDMPDIPEHHAMPFIKEALELVRTIKQKLALGDITLEDALHLSLELEESAVEGFFWDVLTGENDMQALASLKQLIETQQAHGKKIVRFMDELGIPHRGFKPDIPGD
ncbi:MAG: hypothetical protein M0Z61_17530 [Nitrospiraceae bacterium]|nr:hypothetical protein [Nitrospiraceae bacterium]